MKWQRINNVIHRDLGYLCVGMSILYAVSGIAANHRSKWNPAFKETKMEMKIDPQKIAQLKAENGVKDLVTELKIQDEVRDAPRADGEKIRISLKSGLVEVNKATGDVLYRKRQNRFILREMNSLHKNFPQKAWTYLSDIYAIALILVSLTGLFMLKGKKGLKGRGGILAALGIILPLILAFAYF